MQSALANEKIPSWKLGSQAAVTTYEAFGSVLSRALPQLIGLQVLLGIGNQFFTYAIDSVQESGREELGLIALVAVLELLFTMLWSSAWILVVAFEVESHRLDGGEMFPTRPLPRVRRDFNQLMIEQIRALASVIWRSPLLLVPALIEYVRLSFVPLVVVLDPEYWAGRKDALKASRMIARGHFFLLSSTLLISSVIPWMLEEMIQGQGGPYIWRNPIGVLVSWVVTLLINLAGSIFLIQVFRTLMPQPRD